MNALWPSAEVWERAHKTDAELKEIVRKMKMSIEDPSTNVVATPRGPDGPDASDPYANVSTPPGAGCAEFRSIEGSSIGIQIDGERT